MLSLHFRYVMATQNDSNIRQVHFPMGFTRFMSELDDLHYKLFMLHCDGEESDNDEAYCIKDRDAQEIHQSITSVLSSINRKCYNLFWGYHHIYFKSAVSMA